jgi:hypothetical protein
MESARNADAAGLPSSQRTREPLRSRDLVGAGLVTLAAIAVASALSLLGVSWGPWAWGFAGATAVAAVLFVLRAGQHSADEAGSRVPAWLAWAVLVVPATAFVLGILMVLEFIKDDAYISFRYAHNLVTGHGLVFNTGERVEGITNFLWTLLLAPFEALHCDLFQVCEVLGTALGLACLLVTARLTAWASSDRLAGGFSYLWSAVWLSSSSSFVLWAKSGLEQPLASFLPIAGAYVLWTARAQAEGDGAAPIGKPPGVLARRYLQAGLILGAGCITRPELHLMAIIVALPLAVDIVRRRSITRAEWLFAAGVLAVTVPCHAFRLAYYGSLVPNTFYVKTGTGANVFEAGLASLRDMFDFNFTGALVLFAPFAFIRRKALLEKATMAIAALAFMVFYVRVGIDEMQWHRLFLPALPFLCVLAALGAQNLVEAYLGWTRADRRLAYAMGWGLCLYAAYANCAFTYEEQNGFNGHGDLAGTFHPDLGKFLVRHERPGALVAFQDMGSTPYHAPDINFLDFFGLVDKTVAHARYDRGLHTFVNATNSKQKEFDAAMRDYFFERNPEWVIMTIYAPSSDKSRVLNLYNMDPTGASFGREYDDNNYQFGVYDDPRFRQRYVPVRTWPRSVLYYLALWRRRDLWEQTPREVVLDAPPANLAGSKAVFEGGLELLGSEITRTAPERHEAFITTWWRVPGPMPKDLNFFVHVRGSGHQFPADHVPGDWMYPADRWQPGQIVEDRILFQIPPESMLAGSYDVLIGAYRRSNGARLPVVEGPNDGENRIALGTLEVTPLWPLVQHLIPPTNVDVMRKHEERIVDSHRKPGT